jgi:uncharacterized protein
MRFQADGQRKQPSSPDGGLGGAWSGSSIWIWWWVALLLLTGCGKAVRPAPQAAAEPREIEPLHLQRALSNLPRATLWVGAHELSTEVCLSPQQLATGMMFRTNLQADAAMLFPFVVPHRAAFYMRNTTVPLSAAYIDPEGVILEIHDLIPLDEKAIEAASDQIQYVLEVNQGWFARHGVATGAVVRTSLGHLREVFKLGRTR